MTDALERLKQRKRPTVPSRDASLEMAATSDRSLDISTSRYLDSKSLPPTSVSTATTLAPLETKQTTLRFEKGLSDRLQDFCRAQGICREALLEALFEHCEAHPEIRLEVLTKAIAKNDQRQQLANQKRAQSMMQRFGQQG